MKKFFPFLTIGMLMACGENGSQSAYDHPGALLWFADLVHSGMLIHCSP